MLNNRFERGVGSLKLTKNMQKTCVKPVQKLCEVIVKNLTLRTIDFYCPSVLVYNDYLPHNQTQLTYNFFHNSIGLFISVKLTFIPTLHGAYYDQQRVIKERT